MGWGSKNVGSFLEAGLPNITGSLTTNHTEFTIGNLTSDGALSSQMSTSTIIQIQSSPISQAGVESIKFDASSSNSLYGASTTVQPPSYIVYYIMKIK